MDLQATYLVLIVWSVNLNVAIDPKGEVCDIEGSGTDDCPVYTHCCRQTECDAVYDSNRIHDNYIDIEYIGDTLRCCSEAERNKDPKPSDCKVCIQCCDEVERNKIPLPDHCSKCRSCGHSSMTMREKENGKHLIGFQCLNRLQT